MEIEIQVSFMHTNRHNMYIKFMYMYIDSIALQTHVITEAHMQLHTLKTQTYKWAYNPI